MSSQGIMSGMKANDESGLCPVQGQKFGLCSRTGARNITRLCCIMCTFNRTFLSRFRLGCHSQESWQGGGPTCRVSSVQSRWSSSKGMATSTSPQATSTRCKASKWTCTTTLTPNQGTVRASHLSKGSWALPPFSWAFRTLCRLSGKVDSG